MELKDRIEGRVAAVDGQTVTISTDDGETVQVTVPLPRRVKEYREMEELKKILNEHHLTLKGMWGCSCGEEYGRNYRNPEVRGKMIARHDHHLARILYAAGATLPAADPREALRARAAAAEEAGEAEGWDIDAAKNDPDSPLMLRTRAAGGEP